MSYPWEELYQTVIIDHSRHPHNKYAMACPHACEEGFSPLCGDRITVAVRLDDDGRLAEVAFEGHGCAISQSSASLMTDAVKGMTPAEAAAMARRFVAMVTARGNEPPDSTLGNLRVMAGVRKFPMRVKCATLAWHALEGVLRKIVADGPGQHTCSPEN